MSLWRLEVKQGDQHATRMFMPEYIDEPQFWWMMAQSLDSHLLEDFGHVARDRQWFAYEMDFHPWRNP